MSSASQAGPANLSISSVAKRQSTLSYVGKISKQTVGPIKPMHEVFTSPKNKAKFSFPMGLASARELELTIKKEKQEKEEQAKKHQK